MWFKAYARSDFYGGLKRYSYANAKAVHKTASILEVESDFTCKDSKCVEDIFSAVQRGRINQIRAFC